MANHENLSTPFIYLRSKGEKISVTKEQRDVFYKEADRIRHKEQDHGRCMCPYRFIWRCDGDCLDCEYHAAGDITFLDQPLSDGNGTLGDYSPTVASLWKKSSPTVCCWSSFLPDCMSSIRMLIPSFSTGLMITRSQIVQSPRSLAASSVPSLIR